MLCPAPLRLLELFCLYKLRISTQFNSFLYYHYNYYRSRNEIIPLAWCLVHDLHVTTLALPQWITSCFTARFFFILHHIPIIVNLHRQMI
jgi:hypothetical protein